MAIYLTKVYYVYKPFIFNTKNAKSAVQLAENAVGALATECRQLLGQSKKSSRTKVALRPFTELSTNRGCPQILVGPVSLYASVIES